MAHFTLYVLSNIIAPNPTKAAVFLETLGLDYEMKVMELGDKPVVGVKSAEFLKLNPNGRTPALVDHQNKDFVVFESGAILEYLAEKYDTKHKYSGANVEERAIVNEWHFFQATGHSPIQGQLYFALVYWKDAFNEDPPKNVVVRFRRELERVLSVFDARLKSQGQKYGEANAWLALDRMTIADVAAVSWLYLGLSNSEKTGVKYEEYPSLLAYVKRGMETPGVKAVEAKKKALGGK
ncbi:glutathione transferase [Malassezia sp. CBS 17886]|nr:glutathione transferase [Malassezia sp. CBS 17886]